MGRQAPPTNQKQTKRTHVSERARTLVGVDSNQPGLHAVDVAIELGGRHVLGVGEVLVEQGRGVLPEGAALEDHAVGWWLALIERWVERGIRICKDRAVGWWVALIVDGSILKVG